jgi:tetratricopeptide (TPR) repeat protein
VLTRARFGVFGNIQLKALQFVLGYFVYANTLDLLSRHVKLLMVETLIAASYFSDIAWKYKALDTAENILVTELDPHLEAEANLRRRMLDRLYPWASRDQSRSSFRPRILRNTIAYDRLGDAQYSKLQFARAVELMEKDKFDDALSELKQIGTSYADQVSTLECTILRQKDFAIGRIYRFQGRFRDALDHFRSILPYHQRHTRSYRSLISHIAETLIELGDVQQASSLLWNEIGRDTICDKGLLFSQAEVHLHRRAFRDAEFICQSLKTAYETTSEPDKNYTIFYLRVLTVLARCAHLEGRLLDAFRHWDSSLVVIKTLASAGWEENGFCGMVILYSLADIELKTGRVDEARKHLHAAREMFAKRERSYWCTGLGTYWINALGTSVEASGEFRVDERFAPTKDGMELLEADRDTVLEKVFSSVELPPFR